MRFAVAASFLVLPLVPVCGAAPLLSGFATDLPGSTGDDAFEVWNPDHEPVLLQELFVTDGEGRLGFPPAHMIGPGERIRVAVNGTAYAEAARAVPDFALVGPADRGTLRVLDPGFALAQDGDELALKHGSDTLDVVVWGDGHWDAEGWNGGPVAIRGDDFLRWFPREGPDTDGALDWQTPRRAYLGWRDGERPTFPVAGEGTAYTAPERSREMVSGLLARAEASLRLNVYEFRDVGIANDLLARMAQAPDLRVSVLVDELPVGQTPEERLVSDRILAEVAAAGGEVRLLRHARYNFDHAKYLVVDDRWVLVQSENFVYSGLPPDGTTGNRGWGILLDDEALAATLAGVFDHDFELDPYGARAFPLVLDATTPLPPFSTREASPVWGTATARGFNATLLVGPEANLGTDDAVLEAIGAATSEVLVEHLRLPPVWRDASGQDWPNLYLEALLDAAGRGVTVRILLDGHFLDGRDNDNEATAVRVAAVGHDLPIEVRLERSPEAGVLHVKGLVVDRRVAVLGSTNWNLNSVAQNREVAVRVDAQAFAALFGDAFDSDWSRAGAGPAASTTPDAGPSATVITLAFLALGMRARRPR